VNIDADDKLIWEMGTGTMLTAAKDLLMEGSAERAFTAGHRYRVESMHPIASPAFVRMINDQGLSHSLEASHVREFFRR
jgi:hypothetical protein